MKVLQKYVGLPTKFDTTREGYRSLVEINMDQFNIAESDYNPSNYKLELSQKEN